MSSGRLGPAILLQPGDLSEVRVEGEPYAVCNVEGSYYAVSGTCPHQGGPLGQGALHGYNLVCPWHAWEFDCRTGECTMEPSITVEPIPVETRDGDLYLRLS